MADENYLEKNKFTLEIIKAIGGILIPVSIFAAGAWISKTTKDADDARLQQEKSIADEHLRQQEIADDQKAEATLMANLLKNFSSDKAQERVIAVKYAETLIENGQVSRAYLSILDLAKKDANPEVAAAGKTATENIERKVESNPTSNVTKELAKLDKTSNLQFFKNLTFRPRVFIHISNEAQRADAKKIVGVLESKENNFLVPGIERLNNMPKTTEVRFSHRSDETTANKLKQLLEAQNVQPVNVVYLQGYEDSTSVKGGTFEIWFNSEPIRN